MTQLKSIIAEDEPIARSILQKYISKDVRLKLCATFKSAEPLIGFLKNEAIDLLFLDIKMPEISGIDFLRLLSNPPMVIFTTAYREFAADGFDLNAVDYLVKPFSLDRFLLAVDKAVDFSDLRNKENKGSEHIGKYLFIKDGATLFQIEINDILYIEALREYIKIVTSLKTYVVHQSMKNVQEKLPPGSFIRIHKSYIVAIDKITSVAFNKVNLQNNSLPVSRQLKKDVLDRIINDRIVIRNDLFKVRKPDV